MITIKNISLYEPKLEDYYYEEPENQKLSYDHLGLNLLWPGLFQSVNSVVTSVLPLYKTGSNTIKDCNYAILIPETV